LVIPILCACKLQEPSQITLPSENIVLGSFQENLSNAHVVTVLLNQDIIFFMNAEDTTNIGIPMG